MQLPYLFPILVRVPSLGRLDMVRQPRHPSTACVCRTPWGRTAISYSLPQNSTENHS